MMKMRPITRRSVASISDSLSQLHPVLQRIYAARQIQSAEAIDYTLQRLLHFKNLKGIDQAATLLAQVIKKQKRILIIGDFDADGATSTALAVSALACMGAKTVDYLIPNRLNHGYGLSPEIVNLASQRNPDLLVTVDNGIASYEGVIAAQQAGMQVIITDHHLVPDKVPPADAIVNPQQAGDQFSSKHLAGVGVIFYVMLALRHHLQTQRWFETQAIPCPNMKTFLDLVALGTVADMVPLDHNNRILVHHGLQQLRANQGRPGIHVLAQVAACHTDCLGSNDLSFKLAPRLNAAGRLKDMSLGVACLLAPNEAVALPLAQQLNALNQERRLIEHTTQSQAFNILDKLNLSPDTQSGICLFDPSWHPGVVGLIAGRIKERYNQPTVVFAKGSEENEIKGSARSIPGLHIRDALANIANQHPNLINRFGGHAMAAGLSLLTDQYARFVEAFNQEIQQRMVGLSLQAELQTDGALAAIDFTVSFAELLKDAGPWGQGFPEPLFDGIFQVLDQKLVGQKHLQLRLSVPGRNRPIKAIMFNVNNEHWPNLRINRIEATYYLNSETWQGRRDIQLIIESLSIASPDKL